MAAQCAGRRAGGIKQDGISRTVGFPFRRIFVDEERFQTQPLKIFLKPRQPPVGPVEGGYTGTGSNHLGGFTAGCRTQVIDRLAADLAKQGNG